MLTTRHVRRASARFNAALFVIPVALLVAAAIHRSWTLGVAGLLTAVLMAAFTAIGRSAGEAGRVLSGKVDDERHAEIQIRAWANVGQALMVLFVAIWLIRVLIDGDSAVRDGHPWMLLLLAGGAVGGTTVLWLQRES